MKTIAILSLPVLMVLSSCSTMFKGTSQRIDVKTNIPGATVKLDGKEVGVTPLKVSAGKGKDHVLEISKPGYNTLSFDLKRYTAINAINFGNVGFALVSGYLLFPKEKLHYGEPGYDEKAAKQNTALIEASTIPWAIMGVAYGVDAITHANKKFEFKSIDAQLYKTPEIVNPEQSVLIGSDHANFKISPGAEVGSIIIGGKLLNHISWESTQNVKSEELVVQLNNQLSKFGYRVPGLRDTKGEMAPEKDPDVRLNASITSVKYNSNKRSIFSLDGYTDCTLEIEWELVNSRTQKILYFKKDTATALRAGLYGTAVVFEAFNNSLSDILNDKNFRDKVLTRNKDGNTGPEGTDTQNPASALKLLKKADKIVPLTESVLSVVTVKTEYGHGSGFFINENGYLVTNFHVVDGYKQVKIELSSGMIISANVIRTNSEKDLALLKVEGEGFKSLPVGNSDLILLGEEVNAIGTPLDEKLGQTITKGVISGNRIMNENKYLQTDVSINFGNSGGPLLNKSGEVIGVVTLKEVGTGVEGLGFAIPINDAIKALNLDFQ